MKKTLIVYGTRKGTTTDTAHTIEEVLRKDFNQEVDICDSGNLRVYKKRLNEFDNVIIGSSIVSGNWKSSILTFAKKGAFEGKNIALFVTAGGTLNKVNKYGITKQEAEEEAIQKYIDKYLGRFKFNPVDKAAFGGKVIRKGVLRYSSWNKTDIMEWARKVGDKFN